MADGVDIDLYSDDIDQNFTQMKEGDYVGDDDLYDDVVAAPSSEPHERNENENGSIAPAERSDGNDANGSYSHMGNTFAPNHPGRRHQLYVGNLTWWTTDQDITDAVNTIGVTDFQEVKFFENRANGQSKGFCVITLGSEPSMRMCLERLPKNELHGQKPIVTLPTKAALAQFESQQKTRPIPPTTNPSRGQAPMQPGPMQGNFPQGPQVHGPPRMMMPNGPSGPGFRPQHMPPQNMGMPPNQGPPRMQQPMMQGRPMGPQGQGPQGMPRFPNQNQWNPRQNGPRPIPNGPPGNGPPQRPMFQPGGMPPRGPRGDWNRPPGNMHQGGFQAYMRRGMPNQSNMNMQGPPRGPPNQQMGPGGPNNMGQQQMPAPHVNPAFFNQNSGPPQGHPHGHPNSGMNQPPQNMPHSGPQHFPPMDNGPRFHNAVKPQSIPPTNQFPEQPIHPQMSEAEFEEIMTRNRTVSSSAIARAVSDAAAGETMSAIETLVTAISLIKQSKVAHDERCKILISSLQDTLNGIESKSYRRSRSRDRSHRGGSDRRPRRSSRERSTSKDRSRYRERSRERSGRSYYESGSSYRDARSRSRDRNVSGTSGAGNSSGDHYSERSNRPRNKSPDTGDPSESSKRSYYDERYNRSSRDRDRDRRDDREHRGRH
ncbi:cleavage and polyadenylation specificity factor subunit CG7185 isoform X1 [Contarinia nasturtii]|uniref:cleavage and polyadenylation specificity factor subunit CG7185 isoform X1 n=1 Tax=Contarinia nasturtii TaxID=265458 RepID=UPI0012D4746D|nr:cleavage and polyadenylation specificity factor subunit CG7185 isoform X1 [Contarinia nasturtii]